MAIDTWQKIVDIALKGVAASAIAAGGVYVALQKNQLDHGEKCSNLLQNLYKVSGEASGAQLEALQAKVKKLIALYGETCGPLEEPIQQSLVASIQPPAPPVKTVTLDPKFDPKFNFPMGDILSKSITPTIPIPVETPASTGWVAVGRIGGSFGQINFDGTEKLLQRPPATAPDMVLTARWSVNLRTSSQNTEAGNNPVLRVLQPGECVKPLSAEELRGQVWARVEVVACPG
jgi:hypothetical protein